MTDLPPCDAPEPAGEQDPRPRLFSRLRRHRARVEAPHDPRGPLLLNLAVIPLVALVLILGRFLLLSAGRPPLHEIDLPEATPALEAARLHVRIQMAAGRIEVDGDDVAWLGDGSGLDPEVMQGHRITPLYDRLLEKAEDIRALNEPRASQGLDPLPIEAGWALDRRLPLAGWLDALYTAREAGVEGHLFYVRRDRDSFPGLRRLPRADLLDEATLHTCPATEGAGTCDLAALFTDGEALRAELARVRQEPEAPTTPDRLVLQVDFDGVLIAAGSGLPGCPAEGGCRLPTGDPGSEVVPFDVARLAATLAPAQGLGLRKLDVVLDDWHARVEVQLALLDTLVAAAGDTRWPDDLALYAPAPQPGPVPHLPR
ncbi:MAG: hypothetical protein ABIO70_20110 [Pseudomonadota bacterium]